MTSAPAVARCSLSPAQIHRAYGKTFEAPGIIPGCKDVVFCGVWPTGNVSVKKPSDDANGMGPFTVSAETAKPLFAAIERRYNRRGSVAIQAGVAP